MDLIFSHQFFDSAKFARAGVDSISARRKSVLVSYNLGQWVALGFPLSLCSADIWARCPELHGQGVLVKVHPMATQAPTVSGSSVSAPSVSATRRVVRAGQFGGAFKQFAVGWFGDLFAYGLSKKAAQLVAEAAMAQLGDAMAESPKLAAEVGKAKAEGVALKFSGKSGVTSYTPALALIRAVQQLEKLRKEGLLVSRVNVSKVPGLFPENVEKFIAKCEAADVDVEG